MASIFRRRVGACNAPQDEVEDRGSRMEVNPSRLSILDLPSSILSPD
jgi:hypothetical protein